MSYGSIGAGSLSQLCMEAVGLKAGGGGMVRIPYGGSPQAVAAGDPPRRCAGRLPARHRGDAATGFGRFVKIPQR